MKILGKNDGELYMKLCVIVNNSVLLLVSFCLFCLAVKSIGADEAVRDVSAGDGIALVRGPQLFIDDYLIEQSESLVRTTHQPVKLAEPILGKSESWHLQPLFFMKVIHEPGVDSFKMWYNIKNPGKDPSVCYAYAESRDGIKWDRPNLGLVSIDGSTDNNVIAAPLGCFSMFFVDEGPDYNDPQERYKLGYWGPGLAIAFSSDGLNFREYEGNPVIMQSLDGNIPFHKKPGYVHVIGDILDGCWDPLKKQYLLACKIDKSGYEGAAPQHFPGWRRAAGMSVSKDFIHWRRPWFVATPDVNNGLEEFYGFLPMVRGNLYIGFLRVLRDDLPAEENGAPRGIGWTELITSRDGENWERYQEKFIDRNEEPGTWDRAMVWLGDCVTVGDKEYVYYGGYSAGHKIGDRQIGLAMLRKNGFVSRDAGSSEGSLRTPLVKFSAMGLTLNANVRGVLRVRILDQQKEPIAGFDWGDSEEITGDSTAHVVGFKGRIRNLAEQLVHIEFSLRDGKLYGFDVR